MGGNVSLVDRHFENAERCVCCGAVIPEGSQACIICGLKANFKQSTADVVAVVRCKDCIYHVAEYCTRDIKGRTNMFYMTADDFCSYGVRKDGDKK